MKNIEGERFVGRRFRFPGETCPLCEDPGCGMILDLKKQRWICSRCILMVESEYGTSTL